MTRKRNAAEDKTKSYVSAKEAMVDTDVVEDTSQAVPTAIELPKTIAETQDAKQLKAKGGTYQLVDGVLKPSE